MMGASSDRADLLSVGGERNVVIRLVHLSIDFDAPTSRTSSIFFGRIVGVVFMRVNLKCAHQVRPPPAGRGSPVYSARKTFTGSSRKARYAGTRLAI
jgi:hypothetical protein